MAIPIGRNLFLNGKLLPLAKEGLDIAEIHPKFAKVLIGFAKDS
ncbi:hypothetical protein [Ornithinibacillus scapharcae]|nr:hypothetical protein [Ornithinibacillus scapharcae]